MRWSGKLYKIEYHKKAIKDITKLKDNKLDNKARKLIDVLKLNPFQIPPPYEKLVGELKGYYSRRINIQHRLIYKVEESRKVVQIISLWSRYENV